MSQDRIQEGRKLWSVCKINKNVNKNDSSRSSEDKKSKMGDAELKQVMQSHSLSRGFGVG